MLPSRCTSALTVGATLFLSACASSSGGSLGDYAIASGTPVKTRCASYLVARHPEASRLLVTPYAGNIVQPICEGIRGSQVQHATTGVNYEDGAREYLASNPALAACRIVAGETFGPLHSEFTFTCPTPPEGAAVVAKG